ncbi:MAG: DAK2 domain-containing protein [Butyrivibrio sp.]
MTISVLDGRLLCSLLINGYRNLKRNITTVDELNVFPVPDGDTGKNMTATLEGGISCNYPDDITVSELMKRFSHGALLSARGNSGVILSQIIRGIAKHTEHHEILTVSDFISSLNSGAACAYSAVAQPVEGTMLTVIREAAENAGANCSSIKDFTGCLELVLSEMRKSLARTPELLPVLKEAGVIDSGGAGLVYFFEGMLMYLKTGEFISDNTSAAESAPQNFSYDPENLLTYGYCTEFILQLQASKTDINLFNINDMNRELEKLGNSIVAVQDGSLVKVHIHSFEPEKIIGYARTFGELVTIKIENMTVQHSETEHYEEDSDYSSVPVKYAVAATASGSGIIKYFKDTGASAIINGGQTNNPSAEDFISAFRKINAEYIIVLPNDSNIIMTAMQAASMYTAADVRVIPTKSIAEGCSALSMFDTSLDTVEDVITEMTCYLSNVTTGYVTTATRDAFINGVNVVKDDYIGLIPDCILSDSPDKVEAALSLIANLPDIDDKQIVTAFCGWDVTQEEKDTFRNELLKRYPLIEIGMIDGNQDIYSFIFSIE